MSKKGNKKRQEILDNVLGLNDKLYDAVGGILKDIPNLSDEDKLRLQKSGVLNDLGDSMTKLDESMDKLKEKIKKKNG